ncbi:RHS repeat-associated core domain-containing protein [Pseudomonas sp. NBRC 111132]|uniref:RHS repeat-associated core domain-containing protein n=1 Tax=Pseudomonas sp. NBRC 111132 TaxID=1661047 RepID=UPI0009E6A856|nr:RHS repeat-associated core domain-containing protein [Pseudomonas sp. NBRC 111132]
MRHVGRKPIGLKNLMRSADFFGAETQVRAYSPYGYLYRFIELYSPSRIGFNGERWEFMAKVYFLGNGYRCYSPALMRFNSPDNMSPFAGGGVNAYAYCLGDPVNLKDPSGHLPSVSLRDRLIKTFPIFADIRPKASIPKAMQSSQSMPSLIDRPLQSDPPSGWKVIGYHGGLSIYKDSLTSGINPRLLGTLRPQDFGEGFYMAPSANSAARYAWNAGNSIQSQPQLYEVYAPSFDHLRSGRDYMLTMAARNNGGYSLDLLEVVIRPPAYSKIEIRVARLRDNVKLPRSHEAPF